MQLLGYYNKKVKTVSSGGTVENCPCRSLNKGKGEKGVKMRERLRGRRTEIFFRLNTGRLSVKRQESVKLE